MGWILSGNKRRQERGQHSQTGNSSEFAYVSQDTSSNPGGLRAYVYICQTG